MARRATCASPRHVRSRRACQAAASSASHSARNSRRARLGARRETSAMKRRTRSGMTGTGAEPAEIFEALHRDLERGGAGPGDLVVAADGALFAPRDLLVLPAGSHVAERIEPPERGIDGPGLE